MEDIDVVREGGAARGRYVIHLPDGHEAEMTFGRRDPATVVVDHTFVPPEFRGHGLAEKLVQTLIADARREGFRIVPVCSYVAVQFRRHPEWADLRAQ
ncbi:MAG TPA: N-acetyltransferase [Alphaproteobacteria bacterium]|nr:N-acetyltransferase [Alphaproteobacteria bacterium]